MSKYHNRKVVYDSIVFDSVKEKNRYMILKQYEEAGAIKKLQLQKSFELIPGFILNGKKIRGIKYICDFYYYDNNLKKYIVEDVKGMRTDVYKIKKKLFEYKYNIEINEV